jgi:hypothetical protein
MIIIQIFVFELLHLIQFFCVLFVLWVLIRIVGVPLKYFWMAIFGIIKN